MIILFPHQLFEIKYLPKNDQDITLIEEDLFFKQYRFHKQKLVFHRASMKHYEDYLNLNGYRVTYIESFDSKADIRNFLKFTSLQSDVDIHFIDPVDDWLSSRIKGSAASLALKVVFHESPMFLNSNAELKAYFENRKRYFQTDFYINQRKKRSILLDSKNKPLGGKWSFDAENRNKYPKNKKPVSIEFPNRSNHHVDACKWVEKYFSENYGDLNFPNYYPLTHESAKTWLSNFFSERFHDFGKYEDAIVANESFLNHSILSPLLNSGLLTPSDIISEVIDFLNENDIPLNSSEGFIRQIIGWREFVRGVYTFSGRYERTRNYWNFKRKIPAGFWNGTTGIEPIDNTIGKILKTGYCHHIERLMVIGNFMLLCEFDPDEVYIWFMEMFVDSYDWVMVPNVYGMSQFADGGLFSTKPYISGSNYILKMSDYPRGDWQKIWDALFWRFMDVHRDFFLGNPRLGMLIKTFDKKSDESKSEIHSIAQTFLSSLDTYR
jgi:deoxyribodipyrimidine photolyase-related protein